MRSIVDANVTHILIGAVLFIIWFRTNKRFRNYIIGIITSLFTSILLQESLSIKTLLKKANLTFVTNFSKDFYKLPFRFLKRKKWTYLFSAVVVVVSIVIGDKQIRSRS
jgi:SecD/SecF fusion protein